MTDEETRAAYPLLRFFEYDNLRPGTLTTGRPFQELAHELARLLPPGPETTVCLRKLLESRDAALRAAR